MDVGAAGINAPGTVTDDSSVLSFAATVSSNDLIVTATRTPTYSNTAPSGGAAGASSALTSLSDAGATGDLQTVLQALDGLTGEAQGNAIATTIPQVNGGTSVTAISATTQTLGTVSTRLAELRSGLDLADRTGVSAGNHAKGIGVWIQGFSNFADQARRRQIEGFRASTWGAALGGDKTIGEKVTVGGAFSYARTNVNSKGTSNGNGSGSDLASYQGTLYASYDRESYYVEGMVNVGFNDADGVRKIVIDTLRRTAKSDYWSQQYTGKVSGGYDFKRGNVTVTPTASLQYTHLDVDGYTETGANDLNLIVESQDYNVLQTGLGGKVAYNIETKKGTLVPELSAVWLYDFIGDKQQSTSTFNAGGGSFGTDGAEPPQHSAAVGVGLSFRSSANITLAANYDAEIKSNFLAHSGRLKLRYDF